MPRSLSLAQGKRVVTLARPILAPLCRLLASTSSPSADLYLGFSCADLLASGQIERFAPTVFRYGRTLIVIRHESGLAWLPDHDDLIYVIDDDWRGGVADGDLPLQYRARMMVQEGRAAFGLEAAASIIVASNPVLAWRLRNQVKGAKVVVMAPAWPKALAPLPPAQKPARSIVYLGAATHRSDMNQIVPVIDAMLARFRDARFAFSANHLTPRYWRDNPQITAIPAMPWAEYRQWMTDQQFDIGLYPLGDGPFNASRSSNKLAEYDQFGAAVLGSDRWTDAAAFARIGACTLVGDTAVDWERALVRLLTVRGAAHDLAKANRAVQAKAGLARQRTQWGDLLPGLSQAPHEGVQAHG